MLFRSEMKSTGEVMGTGRTFGEAYAKAQSASGVILPRKGVCFISVRDRDKPGAVELAKNLIERGFEVLATEGTAGALAEAGVACRRVNKVREGRPHIVDMMLSEGVQLVFNTTEGAQAISDSFGLRRTALTNNIPYYTTVAGARAAVQAIAALKSGGLEVATLQSYF